MTSHSPGWVYVCTTGIFGVVEDPDTPGKNWTGVSMNGGIKESELPERFDGREYLVLLLAQKYQTGFD